jgi:hypothetical protein
LARKVHEWGQLLESHLCPDGAAYIKAVQAMSTMLRQALSRTPNVTAYTTAAKEYHKVMSTHFPKVTMRIYQHALLVHVPDILKHGSLLDGSS